MSQDDFVIAALFTSLFLFVVYHLFLLSACYAQSNAFSGRSSQPSHNSVICKYICHSKVPVANNMENSNWWVMKHREKFDAQNATLAIHTLRNAIMVAVFVGETANGMWEVEMYNADVWGNF
jgi:hypothetical protein